ncbi:Glu/Leu/Phe/Val dehydrogenase dimerization domain-containing protein [Novosphingobium sp. Gsoil 351]|uniref:Glu/Leu/Phe/Val dehydrogenase dimerization domain-containing protein n=1 Tax=Novosphingobium sp. Gsoil 351 TaxID=2675225 RepID=UPI0012B4B966|nr:Glu/Leu/Phe/Val dehydrogenase dimerization domain-containing protein [Novosphingobium sp. Gsoil 351]QGN55640.1 amino acid dehydrogenase [Novosphingobium sp. Gsoil 351]
MSTADLDSSDHELVAIYRDAASDLVAIVAVHDRALGPAIGGCRMLPYATLEHALTDVLRLSRGMTYKCAIAGIPYGGGKAVIIGDPLTAKNPALLHAFGDFVESLGGRYITSFDSGTTLDDIRVIGERTQYSAGYADGYGNASASTAIGVFHCMARAWREVGGTDLRGVRVGIQGLGNVGARLAGLLGEAGAVLTVADTDPARDAQLFGAVVAADEILSADIDILAPCALGAILNERSIPTIRARVIAGGANNQLAANEDADLLRASGILYCPDYLTNAGGIVELHHQRMGSTPEALAAHLATLADTLGEVIVTAAQCGKSTAAVADHMAEARFHGARG